MEEPLWFYRYFEMDREEPVRSGRIWFRDLMPKELKGRIAIVQVEMEMPIVEGFLTRIDRNKWMTRIEGEGTSASNLQALVSYPFVYQGSLADCLDRLSEYGGEFGAILEVDSRIDLAIFEGVEGRRFFADREKVGEFWTTSGPRGGRALNGQSTTVWSSPMMSTLSLSEGNVGAVRGFRCSQQRDRWPDMWRQIEFGLCREITVSDVVDLEDYLAECFRRAPREREMAVFLASRRSGLILSVRRGQRLGRFVLEPGTAVFVFPKSEFSDEGFEWIRAVSVHSHRILERIKKSIESDPDAVDPWFGFRSFRNFRAHRSLP